MSTNRRKNFRGNSNQRVPANPSTTYNHRFNNTDHVHEHRSRNYRQNQHYRQQEYVDYDTENYDRQESYPQDRFNRSRNARAQRGNGQMNSDYVPNIRRRDEPFLCQDCHSIRHYTYNNSESSRGQDAPRQEESGIFIKGSINGGPVTSIFLASGANQSLADKSIANEITPIPHNAAYKDIGGNKVKPIGTSNISLKFGNLHTEVSALILPGLPRLLTLGGDFLMQNNAYMNFGNNTIRLKIQGKSTTVELENRKASGPVETVDLSHLIYETSSLPESQSSEIACKEDCHKTASDYSSFRRDTRTHDTELQFQDNSTSMLSKAVLSYPELKNNTITVEEITKRYYHIKLGENSREFLGKNTFFNVRNLPSLDIESEEDE
ncbi:hypothetical protein ABEB36_005792 [Hypothenemus hampei]|uniref:Uncharacterized protein n=1 Tax=Hypothenemus hampei TaxID=57062 RepID=A0ABD1F2I1_HYPHA